MKTALKCSILLFGLNLTACSLIPEYVQPISPAPANYPATQEADNLSMPNSWQQYFIDPELQRFIKASLKNNRDYKISVLRIEEARAQYGIQRSDTLPTINGTADYERSRTLLSGGQSSKASLYRVGLGMSNFELDLFGRVKSLSNAALEEYFATEEAQQTTRTSLIAEVAVNYLNVRSLTERLRITQETMLSREVGLARINRRFSAGIDTTIDLKTAELQLETVRASLAALKREQLQAMNTLNLLVGDQTMKLAASESLATLKFSALPVGVPSDLIERRPDIRAAEHRLKAANANIGAAKAAFFPRIQLTTNIGLISNSFSQLFSGGADQSWSFAPQLTIPIFNYSRNQSNLDLVKVRKNIAIAEYEKVIQTAFSEVSNILVARMQLDKQIEAQNKVFEVERERLRLATRRYDSGIANYLELLDAQRGMFDAEQVLVQLKQILLSNSINLFKVLGGEWEV
ncbi:hypothetical protein LCGC14_0565100 [marine sediment metagenome]|uniref:Uncharacterized protein n=1 Tax=marine sediment metagenome TaxID=412755 RepID=A0A0F9RKN1_9ZZZZ|nr:efflux transporter outer membrane subunit [Methylophaga sp.]